MCLLAAPTVTLGNKGNTAAFELLTTLGEAPAQGSTLQYVSCYE